MRINREQLKSFVMKEMKKIHEDKGQEGRMARSQLNDLIQNAQNLYNQLQEGDELDSWIQAKITKATDYISSVSRSISYDRQEGDPADNTPEDAIEDPNAPVIDRIKELYIEWKPSPDDTWATKYKNDLGRVIRDFDENANLE